MITLTIGAVAFYCALFWWISRNDEGSYDLERRVRQGRHKVANLLHAMRSGGHEPLQDRPRSGSACTVGSSY